MSTRYSHIISSRPLSRSSITKPALHVRLVAVYYNTCTLAMVQLRGINHVLPPVGQSHGMLLLHLFFLLLLLSQIFSQLFHECWTDMRQQDEFVSRSSINALRINALRIVINIFENEETVVRLDRKLF